ncbi:sigma-54-dependent Fis family transcriptional regulator [Micrococcus terreus]|uniref:sigma-54-dependent Fis family transcriptional regulator n=1 Tax=Micrococcus terreus TaxID=574650 RepID=UPI0015A728B4|nr:helix-turn-helix domain-containing protein [Micrococcus terreus]
MRQARELLITQGLRGLVVPSSLVPEEIERSWRRSVSLRVDPTAEPRVLGAVDPDAAILRAAGRILDQWQDSLTDSHLSLLLADQDGRIVSRRIVTPQDERRLDRANAVEGFDFSEGSLGTNGLGTPIEARSVVFVRGPEHYHEALAQLACAGAPLRHPITGRIVGSIALASPAVSAHGLMVSIVRQIGNQIAEELVSQADSRDLELARTYRVFRSSRSPVLVMNAQTVMTDLPTLSHLDTETHAVLWDRLLRHGWSEETFQLELPLLGTVATARRMGRIPQEPLFVLEFTEPLTLPASVMTDASDEPAGGQGIRTDPEASRRADLGPDGPEMVTGPYGTVRRALDNAADRALVLRLTGAPGTGKRHQALAWLRKRTGQEPLTVDAGRLAAATESRPGTDRDWAAVEQALTAGRGVVVTNAEALDRRSRTRLQQSSATALEAGSTARVLLTEQLQEQNSGSIVPTVSGGAGTTEGTVEVTVPSLAELRGELPGVIREVAAGLFPGARPLRFSPGALQSLLAWTWPGNVAELRDVLAGLPTAARTGLVQVQHLPPALRQAAGPRLSRYEQSERETIVAALRDAEWNKSRAAEILGIGRTTLYRKIRSLRIEEET